MTTNLKRLALLLSPFDATKAPRGATIELIDEGGAPCVLDLADAAARLAAGEIFRTTPAVLVFDTTTAGLWRLIRSPGEFPFALSTLAMNWTDARGRVLTRLAMAINRPVTGRAHREVWLYLKRTFSRTSHRAELCEAYLDYDSTVLHAPEVDGARRIGVYATDAPFAADRLAAELLADRA
jgi:hypothetical protein